MIEGGQLADAMGTNAEIDGLAEQPYKEQVLYFIEEEAMSAKDAIKHVAKLRDVKKQVVYQAYHEI